MMWERHQSYAAGETVLDPSSGLTYVALVYRPNWSLAPSQNPEQWGEPDDAPAPAAPDGEE